VIQFAVLAIKYGISTANLAATFHPYLTMAERPQGWPRRPSAATCTSSPAAPHNETTMRALVPSGGGYRGALQAGTLGELLAGLPFGLFVGTSVGRSPAIHWDVLCSLHMVCVAVTRPSTR
jgi:hypothetical protein